MRKTCLIRKLDLSRLKRTVISIGRSLINRKDPPSITGATISGERTNVTIGERVSFGGNVFILANEKVSIGSDTMIAHGVNIITSTHDPSNHPMWLERIDRPVEIGKHVWIGVNAIILPGLSIGDYSIIAAGCVVTTHVPRKAVVMGVPGRIVRYREIDERADTTNANDYPGKAINKGFMPAKKSCK